MGRCVLEGGKCVGGKMGATNVKSVAEYYNDFRR